MSEPITIKATVGAYIVEPQSHYFGIDKFLKALNDPEKHRSIIGSILSYSASDMSKQWMLVGEAEIAVTLVSHDEQVQAAVKALQGQIDKARADFMRTQADLLERISQLQALEYTPEAA